MVISREMGYLGNWWGSKEELPE